MQMLLQTTHTQATGEFFHAYRLGQRQPLTLLCLAVAHVQHAMTRKADDRNRTVLQAFAFLQVSAPHNALTCAHKAASFVLYRAVLPHRSLHTYVHA